ncbi:hypothetical protein MKW98_012973 [Papaver atlanticum]|uniref:FAD-binding domain-containing protein n=1 Tax=Papaver atlanticum TaxID=357466 RepID=A0AAD4SKL3_9MAGN|nr:hypothetical protein MKW98_012973 [Papaver atlanticum]
MKTTNYMEEAEIVIIGGGIGGLATALALHKKGLESVVLERSESIRTTGSAIGIFSNGWRALDQLGVGAQLRPRAVPFTALLNISLNDGKQEEIPLREEARCLKRNDLVQVLADSLPPNTVRFGCHILAVKLDPVTSQPILQLQDGNTIKAKVVIGCDGPVRGHLLIQEFPANPNSSKNRPSSPSLISQQNLLEIVKKCDLDSLTLTRIRYRTPWDILLGNFRKGTVIVAGDAMHIMGPFLGQGGSAALEDAVVLARNLAQAMSMKGSEIIDKQNYAGEH